MQNRRIAIYIGDSKQFAQIKLNFSRTGKLYSIIEKSGESKADFARRALIDIFGTNDFIELKERIIYASNSQDSAIPERIKLAITCRKAIDKFIDQIK